MDIIIRIIHDLTQVHPPHTLFVHFPIALVSAALFFILLALWRHSDILEQVAFANISLAAVSTIAAEMIGLRDNLFFYGGMAPNHTAKFLLASLLFLVTTAIALVRWRNPNIFHTHNAKIVYVLGFFVSFAIVSVLGFLGGVIIYGF
jgi:uncharacterized membrane protein